MSKELRAQIPPPANRAGENSRGYSGSTPVKRGTVY